MRVALLTDGIWPLVIGGMQKHSYFVCKYLAQNMVNVQLYFTCNNYRPDILKDVFSAAEMEFIEPVFVPFPKAGKFPGHYIRESKQYSRRIFDEYIRRDRPDMIYAKGITSYAFLKYKSHGHDLPPICIMVHGYEYYQASVSFKSYIDKLLLRPVFRYINLRADYIHSYGDSITELINRHYPNHKGKIVSIPTAIGSEYVTHEPLKVWPTRRFVFVGRWERRKGIPELLKAVRKLSDQYPFSLTLICDVPDRARIPSSKIIYHGVVSDKKSLLKILSDSDVLICPSFSEGMPNVIFEGMASGCAIIASHVGAISEQVTDKNGWLVPPGDVTALANAMKTAIQTDDGVLLSMRRQSIRLTKDRFLWKDVSKQLLASFEKMVGVQMN